LFDLDGDALVKRSSVTLPANIQYAWPHPSRKYFYVVSSNGGPGVAGDTHFASALRIDPASGALSPHGQPQMLPSRPIHTSVDQAGQFLLIAYNDPSSVTVHHIDPDGSIGAPVPQPDKLDTDLQLQERHPDPARLDRARQWPRLRAAPSRLPPDQALGVRLDRAAEPALCLHAR